MSARILKLLVFSTLLFIPSFAFASVSINEVSYSPSSKQWVEIYNDTESAIDLTGYKILDNGASVSGHAVSAISGGSNIPAHGYAVVAKVPEDFPGASYPLFKASFGIKTSGDTLSLKSGSTVIDTVTIDGSATGGNSWQKAEGNWFAASPTPGVTNASAPSTPPAGETTSTTTATTTSSTSSSMTTAVSGNVITVVSTHYSYLPLSDFTAKKSLAISAGRPRLAAVGNPVEFLAEANTEDSTVAYEWNFGDGTTGSGKMTRHIYEYPGDYVMVLNATSAAANAIARTSIKIFTPALSVIEATPAYIKIKNSSTNEMNLYGWELTARGRTFIFPKDTIIAAGATLPVPANATYMNPSNPQEVSLVAMTPITQIAAPTPQADPALVASREKMYQQLLSLKQAADTLATAQVPQTASIAVNPVPPKQVAAAIDAFTSVATDTPSTTPVTTKGSWFQSFKKFILNQP